MLLHILKRIKSNLKIFIFSYILFFVTIMVIFLLIMFRSVSINKIDSGIIFYKNAVRVEEMNQTQYLPQGFEITKEKVKKVENEFQYVNHMQSSFDLWAKGRQNVSFYVVSEDFINTGVKIYDHEQADEGVQKLELLYGNKWDKDTIEPVTIVDLDTAMLLFGYENVVGQMLSTNYGDLEIVGVVSNTIEREQSIELAKKRGEEIIADYLYTTHAYVSHGYYDTLNLPTYNNDVIISDENMTPEEIKYKLKEIFDIPLKENEIFISREDMIYKNIISRKIFFQIIISVISVFSILGCLNLINITLYTFKINKKNTGIYKIIGYKDKQIMGLSIFENFIKSLICSVISVLLSIIILLFVSLISGTLKFVNFKYVILLSFSLVVIFVLVSSLINIIISCISIKKPIDFYMEED